MAATSLITRSFIASKMVGGTSTETLEATAGATDIRGGDPLIYASGVLVPAAVDDTTVIVGIAAHDQATTGGVIRYYPALPGMLFEGILEDETTNGHALVITNKGIAYAIQKDAGNANWFLDENDTANGIAVIDEFIDPIGTVRARVRFHFEGASTRWAT